MEQLSKQWFAARRHKLTGSNVGAALGLNPWKTPQDLIRQMVREYHGAEPEFQGNVATEWGTFNEDGATAEFTLETGLLVQPCGFFVHPEHEWLGASPDGLVGNHALVEVKCPYGLRDKSKPEFKTAKEQPHYYAQMQIEMACTGRSVCYFYQWAPQGSKVEEVHYSVQWLEENLPALMEFYDLYLSELDNPDHLKPRRVTVNTNKAAMLLEEYDELADAMERAKNRRAEVLGELVQMAGEKDSEICGRKLTQVERAGSVSYAKALKKYAPDADLEPFRGKPTTYWKLS